MPQEAPQREGAGYSFQGRLIEACSCSQRVPFGEYPLPLMLGL
jgi:hypothetical protein